MNRILKLIQSYAFTSLSAVCISIAPLAIVAPAQAAPIVLTAGEYLFNFTFDPVALPPNMSSVLGDFATGLDVFGFGDDDTGSWQVFDGLDGLGQGLSLQLGITGAGLNSRILNGNLSALATITSGSITVDPFVRLSYTPNPGFEALPIVNIAGVLVRSPAVTDPDTGGSGRTVPEPATLALTGAALAGLAMARRRRAG